MPPFDPRIDALADHLIALGWTRQPLGVEEVTAQAQARIAALDARIVDLNAEVLDRMDQWHRDSLARDELARQQNREITRLRNLVNALDEERLARALGKAIADRGGPIEWPDAAARRLANLIAKAYREDTALAERNAARTLRDAQEAVIGGGESGLKGGIS